MLESVRTHHPVHLRNRAIALFFCAAVLLVSGIATAQERTNLDAAKRIRDAALNHSQIMDTIGYLADVTGPRMTGSPNLKRAE